MNETGRRRDEVRWAPEDGPDQALDETGDLPRAVSVFKRTLGVRCAANAAGVLSIIDRDVLVDDVYGCAAARGVRKSRSSGRPLSSRGAARMAPVPHAPYQIGIALDQDRVAVLADADGFALAQAKAVVIAHVLREGAWPLIVVIVRLDDGAVLDRMLVSATRAG